VTRLEPCHFHLPLPFLSLPTRVLGLFLPIHGGMVVAMHSDCKKITVDSEKKKKKDKFVCRRRRRRRRLVMANSLRRWYVACVGGRVEMEVAR
jgi:hypothetical protein